MKSLVPFLIFLLVVVALLVFSARARRRQAQVQLERAERIGVGSEVMTTSGLYGTVVARNDDETATLSIAPGVEVKWALAALRDLETLPRQFRGEDVRADEAIPGDDHPRVDLDKPRLRDNGEAGS